MTMETVIVEEESSAITEYGSLMLSATGIVHNDKPLAVNVSVGRIGGPTLTRRLKVGDAVLYETSNEGVFEVRLLRIKIQHNFGLSAGDEPNLASFGVSRLQAGRGPLGGVEQVGEINTPFTPPEVARIKLSLDQIKRAVQTRDDLKPEQADYIVRKLDDILDAADRVGRRDWINLAIGTVVNVVVGAAVGSDAAKFLFQSLGHAFAWLFGPTLKLLP